MPARALAPDITAACRHWALALTKVPSVNGTADEARFAGQMLALLEARAELRGTKAWTIPVGDDPLGRSIVALLVPGEGSETVILTGHFDTVPIDDYGDLAALALDPEPLRDALVARLRSNATSEAERRALADLESGQFLPGRGLLDMKAGLAAGLAAAEAYAARPDRPGNILFLAVPDEEATSLGARQLARSLSSIAIEHGLKPVAAINLDAIADDGDGTSGRQVTLGSIGKLLLTAFIAGRPTHACYPFAGLNAGALAGAVAAEVEWSAELADPSAVPSCVPPTLLSMKDSKSHYDVTTPAAVWATWNTLYVKRPPAELIEAFQRVCRRAAAEVHRKLTEAARGQSALARGEALPEIAVMSFAELVETASRRGQSVGQSIAAAAESAARSGLNLPEQCRLVTEAVWRLSGLSGPAVVAGFGSLPYLPVALGGEGDAKRLGEAVNKAAAELAGEQQSSIGVSPFFPGISDVSFIGEADLARVPSIAANTPAWGHGIVWPSRGAVAGVPTVNAGPWGRDYHTPLERLHIGYACETLPRLLERIAGAVLARS